MRKKYLELKKDNYLAIIPFAEEKRMVEIATQNEEEAYEWASDYVKRYCERLGYTYVDPVVIRVPDCITIVG